MIHGLIFAQEQVDAIYLKDGSKILGIIIEQIPNTSVKIRMKDGSEFVFSFDKIEKIVKENTSVLPIDLKEKSYLELGVNIGIPSAFNVSLGNWFGPFGLRLSGMSFEKAKGFQVNIEYKLSDNIDRRHGLAAVLGSSKIISDGLAKEWNYFGITYELNWSGFFFETGMSAGKGSFSSPQLLLQIGYMYRFLTEEKQR